MTPARMSSSGRSAPLRIRNGRRTLSIAAGDDGEHQQHRRPQRVAGVVHPYHGRDQHESGADLGEAQDEHQRRQQRGEGNARDGQTDAAQHALRHRGHHDAECHAADRLTGQSDSELATVARQPPAEPDDHGGSPLAAGVHDRGDGDGQQELDERLTHAAEGGDEPYAQQSGIGCELRRQLPDAGRGELAPELCEPLADQRQIGDPLRRRRDPQRQQRSYHIGDFIGIGDDRADRQPARHDQNHQQRQRHDQYGDAAPIARMALHLEHQRPGGDDQRHCPDDRGQERAHDPDAGDDQPGNEQHGQRCASEVLVWLGHAARTFRVLIGPDFPVIASGAKQSPSR